MLQIWRKKLVGNFLDEKFPGGKFLDEKVPIYRKKYVGKILVWKILDDFVPTYRKNFDGKILSENFPGEKIPVEKIPDEFFPGAAGTKTAGKFSARILPTGKFPANLFQPSNCLSASNQVLESDQILPAFLYLIWLRERVERLFCHELPRWQSVGYPRTAPRRLRPALRVGQLRQHVLQRPPHVV